MKHHLLALTVLAGAAGAASAQQSPVPAAPAAAAAATAPAPAAPAGGAAPIASGNATTPTPTSVASPPQATPEPLDSWLVVKGGGFGSAGDYQGTSFTGSGAWEVAVGTGRIVGVELGVGGMTTHAGNLEITTIPLLLSLRLQIPIVFVAPHLDVGAGAYFNKARLGGLSVGAATAGWQAGLGCDFLLGRFITGVDARYMGIAPTFETIGKVTLDRYELLVKAGLRF